MAASSYGIYDRKGPQGSQGSQLRLFRKKHFLYGKLRQRWDVFTPKQVDVFSDFLKGKFAQDSQLGVHDVVLSSRALPN